MAKWLIKASDDILSFCTCSASLADFPGQLDCPWCGCGWMIPCATCRKSFVVAEVVATDGSYSDIVRRIHATYGRDEDQSTVARDAEWINEQLSALEVGERVVYLDGTYFALRPGLISLDGWYAKHALDALPHLSALSDSRILNAILGQREYWFDRERDDRHDDK